MVYHTHYILFQGENAMSIDPIVIAAQRAVAAQTAKVQISLQTLANKDPIFKSLPEFFARAYQNPILTTAVVLQDSPVQVYAGTGGWGLWGPPAHALPLDPNHTGYPDSLSDMWIRDACAQYHSYLGIFIENPAPNSDILALGQVIEGIVRTCATYLSQACVTNCSNNCPIPANWPLDKIPSNILRHAFDWNGCVPSAGCDYEPDSLGYLIFLAADYKDVSGVTRHLDDTFWSAMQAAVNVLSYYATSLGSNGAQLTLTPYRPSDDPCQRKFNIPVNAFLAAMLHRLAQLPPPPNNSTIIPQALALATALKNGVYQYGTMPHPETKQPIFAYETDAGLTANPPLAMDDANVPSLLSLAYLNFCDPTDSLYLATRNNYVLTTANQYFYSGNYKSIAFQGVGSPHTPDGNIWPLALTMQGLTAEAASNPVTERYEALRMLVQAIDNVAYPDPNNPDLPNGLFPAEGYQHESFNPNDLTFITRGWFAWANALFGEWVDQMVRDQTLPTT